jgi:hypothetical protein
MLEGGFWASKSAAARSSRPRRTNYAVGCTTACRVVLKKENWPVWLGEEPAEMPALKALLSPYPTDGMVCWPVSARVGNVKNNDPSLKASASQSSGHLEFRNSLRPLRARRAPRSINGSALLAGAQCLEPIERR